MSIGCSALQPQIPPSMPVLFPICIQGLSPCEKCFSPTRGRLKHFSWFCRCFNDVGTVLPSERPTQQKHLSEKDHLSCLKANNTHLCVVQEERIELLDKLEQFPLKIRVKEEQDSILRWAPFLHSQCLCPPRQVIMLHLCLSTGQHSQVGSLLHLHCTHNVSAHIDRLCCCTCACQQESILRLAGCCVFPALTTSVPMSMEFSKCCMSSWPAFCSEVYACEPVSKFLDPCLA